MNSNNTVEARLQLSPRLAAIRRFMDFARGAVVVTVNNVGILLMGVESGWICSSTKST